MSRRSKRPGWAIRCRDEHGEARRSEVLISLAERQNWRCCYCGCRMTIMQDRPDTATYEHVIPYATVRSWHAENLVVACQGCNAARHGHQLNGRGRKPDGMSRAEIEDLKELITAMSDRRRPSCGQKPPKWPAAAMATLADVWPRSTD